MATVWSDKEVSGEWIAQNAAKKYQVANLSDGQQAGARQEVQRQIIRMQRVDRLGLDVDDWFDAIADESDLDTFIENALGYALLYRWFVDISAGEYQDMASDRYRKMMIESVEALVEYAPQVLSDSGSSQVAGSSVVTWAL